MTTISAYETALATLAALLLASGMLWASAPSAEAGFNCSQFGNQTVCTDDQGNSISCSRFGSQTVCE